MELPDRLDQIKVKLLLLKRWDNDCIIFGAEKHQYVINKPLKAWHIKDFEDRFGIKLPEEFAAFYTTVCNGEAGPYYGLETLGGVVEASRGYFYPNPSRPFQHTQPWNMKFQPTVSQEEDEDAYADQLEVFETIYYDHELMDGSIIICDYGCGVTIHLVLNGPEFGNLWANDRSSDNGIHPFIEKAGQSRLTFLDWYEHWLDRSLQECQDKLGEPPPQEIAEPPKPWWKLW